MTFGGPPDPAALIVEIEGWEAATGASRTVSLPGYAGGPPRVVSVNIPPGVPDGTLLRLPGAGLPGPGGEPGDAFVRVRINNPVPAPPPYGVPVSGPGFNAPVSGPGYPAPVSGPGMPTSGAGYYQQTPYPLGYPQPVPPPSKSALRNPGVIVAIVVVVVLVLCGGTFLAARLVSGNGKPTAAGTATGTAAPGGSPSASASPVTTAVYEQDLATLDQTLRPGFQQLHAAHTPTAVSSAISSMSSGLSTEIDTLRGIAPPASVADAHSTLMDALLQFASDIQSVATAAAGQQVCGGVSALSLLSRSAGATALRAAAQSLATADPSAKVATFLPGPIQPANHRLGNGTYVRSPASRGIGRLKISNGGSTDAAISLVPTRGGKATMIVYVRAKASFTAGRIKDGSYNIFVTTGTDWDGGNRSFTRACDYSKFDTPASWQTTSTTYTQYTITLTPVSGGNASTSDVDPGQFPG